MQIRLELLPDAFYQHGHRGDYRGSKYKCSACGKPLVGLWSLEKKKKQQKVLPDCRCMHRVYAHRLSENEFATVLGNRLVCSVI